MTTIPAGKRNGVMRGKCDGTTTETGLETTSCLARVAFYLKPNERDEQQRSEANKECPTVNARKQATGSEA